MAHDMRSLSHGLHPTILDDLGLEAGLRQLINTLSEQTSQRASFKADNIPSTISPAIATTLYRIAQEALNNFRKHAPQAAVAVALRGFATELQLTIEDDGPGFDTKQKANGLGLISIRERAHLVGGYATITAAPGRGTQIEVFIPSCQSM